MKNLPLVLVVVLVIVLALGYMGRHKIKQMLGMSTPTTMTQTPATSGTPSTTNSAMAPSNNIYMTKANPAGGSYLTDFNGMTLYTFDNDTNGVSSCTGKCLTIWPVYTSGATAQGTFPTNITVITRTDGSKQFAWKGMPLYYYAKDQKAGDMTGDGVGGVWHIVKL